MNDTEGATARAWARDRFPVVDGAPDLVDELLDLHTPRQLVALTAIMDRIEADLRAAPVLAALRLALLHTLLPSSRLATGAGRGGALRVAGGHVRLPAATQWRERNPWLAFEEGFRTVRGFVQRLEGGALGPLQARLGEDLQALGGGVRDRRPGDRQPVRGPCTQRRRRLRHGPPGPTPRVRLVLGQPPMRPSLDRLAVAYHGTAWTLGREAAALLPIDALADASLRAPWSWQAVTIGRALAAVEPSMARDGRVVQLVDGGAEALAAVAIGGGVGRLPRGRRTTVRPGRRRRRRHRAGATRRRRADRAPDACERRPADPSGRCRRSGHGPGTRPVRAAGAVRPATVLGEPMPPRS